MSRDDPVLEVRDLRVGYGRVAVVHGVDLTVHDRSLLGIQGPNGAGKTSLLKGIMGVLPAMSGRVMLNGIRQEEYPCYQRVRSGLGLVPDGRQVFSSLTVGGNLDIAEHGRHNFDKNREDNFPRDEIHRLFPILRERGHQMAGTLSGGEQQMLAIARALLSNPSVLLVDEPTQGLAPILVERLVEVFSHLKQKIAIVVAEQNVSFLTALADGRLEMTMGRCGSLKASPLDNGPDFL